MGDVVKDDKYKQFEPNPGEVWSSSFDGDDPTVYYFVEKLPTQPASARFGPSHHTWKVIVLVAGALRSVMPSTAVGALVSRQFDGVSTGYGPPGREHDLGYDSYDNEYRRLA